MEVPNFAQDSLLDSLPASILLDLARNESATPSWRKAATKFLIKKGYPQAQHPELRWLVHEIEEEERAEKEVVAVVEAAIEQELPPDVVSPSVTKPEPEAAAFGDTTGTFADTDGTFVEKLKEEKPIYVGPINPTSVVKPVQKKRS